MKKQIFLFASILAFVSAFISCNKAPEDPTIATPENTLELLLRYVPDTAGQTRVFINEETGKKWSLTAYQTKHPEQSLPFPSVSYREHYLDIPEKWSVGINPKFEGGPEETGFSTISNNYHITVSGDRETGKINMVWMSTLYLSSSESYTGMDQADYTVNDFLSNLSDTLRFSLTKGGKQPVPDGCYINVVKDKGLTDFCVDGKTVWRLAK